MQSQLVVHLAMLRQGKLKDTQENFHFLHILKALKILHKKYILSHIDRLDQVVITTIGVILK